QDIGAFMLAAIFIYQALSPADRVQRIILPLASFAAVTAVWLGPVLIAVHGDVTKLGVLVGAVNQAGLFSAPEWPVLVPIACLAGGLWLWRREHDQTLRWYLLAGSTLLLTQYPRMDALHLVWSAPLLLVVGAVTLDRLKPELAGLLLVGAFVVVEPPIASRLMAVEEPRVTIQQLRYDAGIDVPEPT